MTTQSGVHRHVRRSLLVGVLVLIIGAGAVIRGLTFDRFYPVIASGDEAKISLHAMDLRADMPMKEAFGATHIEDGYAYPPMALWVFIQMQKITEALVQFPFPTDYVYANRAAAAVLGVLTIALMCWLGWVAARPLGEIPAFIAAAVTGGIWSLDAQVIPVNNLAATDPIYYPFFAISLITTFFAIRQKKPFYVLIALLGVIAAIYTKYIPAYGLWLPGVATLVLLRELGWRRMLPWIALMAVISAISAWWLIAVHDALNMQANEAQRAADGGIFLMFSPARNWHNLKALGQYALDWWWTLPVLIAGAGAAVWSRQKGEPHLHPGWLVVLLPFAAFCMMLYSSIEVYGSWWRARYMLPAAMVVMLLVGVSLAQIWVRLAAWRPVPAPVLLGLFAVLVLPMEMIENIDYIRDMAQPDNRQRVWIYSDNTLNPEGKIMLANNSPTHDLWHRSWAGYNGATTFEWVFEKHPDRQTPADFVDMGVTYLATTGRAMSSGDYSDPAVRAWIEQLYPLKTIQHVPGNGWSLNFHLYRLLPPAVDTDVTFGELITLDGYDINQTQAAPGETLVLRPFWNVARQPITNYNLFVHLYPAGDTTDVITQHDGPPAKPTRPTVTWDDPTENIPGAQVSLTLPEDLPAGDYTLGLGLYDYTTGERLTIGDGSDKFEIPLQVSEPS